MFKHIKEGDVVVRLLAGVIPHKLKVTKVTYDLIYCGSWTFDRISGIEVDECIPVPVSYLKRGDHE